MVLKLTASLGHNVRHFLAIRMSGDMVVMMVVDIVVAVAVMSISRNGIVTMMMAGIYTRFISS